MCLVGNVPLAAVLWSGGISFAGVMAFIFADLIIVPILLIYRKYYGARFAVRITALMFVTMVVAALVVDAVFGALGLIPGGARPGRADIFSAVTVNYKLFLNLAGLGIFATLFALTARRGVTDPVCGMKVDRAKARTRRIDGETFSFCSEHCAHAFEAGAGHAGGGRSGAPAATDPVCGMSVDPAHALRAEYGGQTFHFCSAGCRASFESEPGRYVAAGAGGSRG